MDCLTANSCEVVSSNHRCSKTTVSNLIITSKTTSTPTAATSPNSSTTTTKALRKLQTISSLLRKKSGRTQISFRADRKRSRINLSNRSSNHSTIQLRSSRITTTSSKTIVSSSTTTNRKLATFKIHTTNQLRIRMHSRNSRKMSSSQKWLAT